MRLLNIHSPAELSNSCKNNKSSEKYVKYVKSEKEWMQKSGKENLVRRSRQLSTCHTYITVPTNLRIEIKGTYTPLPFNLFSLIIC